MGRNAIVAGTGYLNTDGSERCKIIAKHISEKMPVILKRDPDNKYDSNAIAVYINTPKLFGLIKNNQVQIGYIKAQAAKSISSRIDNGEKITAFVSSFDLYDEKWPRVSLTLVY